MSDTKKRRIPVLVIALLVLVVYRLFIQFVIKHVPAAVTLQYMILCAIAVILYFTVFDDDLEGLFGPIARFIAGTKMNVALNGVRMLVLFAIPAFIGVKMYNNRVPNYNPPQEVRTIHPAPPTEFAGMSNPLQGTDMELKIGFGLYTAYCSPCHGTNYDGNGPAAYGFKPQPINFRDSATISQLQDSFVFWRIKKGGIGMPVEGQPWNSVMPRWEGFGRQGEIAVPDDQIWMMTMWLYKGTDQKPRTWEH